MATLEIEVAHGLPRDSTSVSNEIQQVLHSVGRRDANKTIKTHYTLRYARRVIARVDKGEENAEGQKRKTNIGTIEVYGLSHKRKNQSYPRLSWDMFHNV